MKLTEKFLQGVKADKRRDILTDRTGLILRIAPVRGHTRKQFRYRYFRDGKPNVVTLGDYGPALTLADAHSLHDDCKQAAAAGQSPRGIVAAYWQRRVPAPELSAGVITVKDVCDEFLKVAETERKRPEQAKYLLESNVLPSLGAISVAALTKRHIVGMLDKIVARGSMVLANRVQDVFEQAFKVAADRDLITVMPLFPRKAAGGEEAPRTRVLSDAELQTLWHGLDQLSGQEGIKARVNAKGKLVKTGGSIKVFRIPRPLVLALKLQLVTAQRRGEIAAGRWDQIADHVWTIPTIAKRQKKRENLTHPVPLSHLAESLLAELKTLAGDSDYWLPSRVKGKAADDRPRSISKAARDAKKLLGMPDWRPHDLRRTARTAMARIGIVDTVAERVLGHSSGDPMVDVYNKHSYQTEMSDALERWATDLTRILTKQTKA